MKIFRAAVEFSCNIGPDEGYHHHHYPKTQEKTMSLSQTTTSRRYRAASIVILAVLFLTASLPNVFAYDDDTHFWLTYYLSRKAGYTHIQSTQVASLTVGVDYDKNTKPAMPSPDNFGDLLNLLSNMQEVHSAFHAMPWKVGVKPENEPMMRWDPNEIPASWRPAAKAAVDKRKNDLWDHTWKMCQNPGIFLHYLQDSFAHEGFLSFIGHQGYERVDFLATDPGKAHRMAESTLRYLVAFRERVGGSCQPIAVRDAETIDLAKALPAGTLAEVRRVVDRFIDANPSKGRTETNIMLAWRSLPDEDKRDGGLPKRDMAQAILGRLECNVVPDSYLARNVVVDEFGLAAADVPRIWLFDLDSGGGINSGVTREYYAFVPQRPVNGIGFANARTEAANKKLFCPRPAQYEMVDCMPFKLVADNVPAVPKCRIKKDDADEDIGKCQL